MQTAPHHDDQAAAELDDLAHDTVIALNDGEFTRRQADDIRGAVANWYLRNGEAAPGEREDTGEEEPRRTGFVNRWDHGAAHGFVTETRADGTRAPWPWFAHRRNLPAGLNRLPKGTHVTFTGTTTPKPGRHMPEAHGITTLERPAR